MGFFFFFTEVWINRSKVRKVSTCCQWLFMDVQWWKSSSGSGRFRSCSRRRSESSALWTSNRVSTTTTSNWRCGKDYREKSCQVHLSVLLSVCVSACLSVWHVVFFLQLWSRWGWILRQLTQCWSSIVGTRWCHVGLCCGGSLIIQRGSVTVTAFWLTEAFLLENTTGR